MRVNGGRRRRLRVCVCVCAVENERAADLNMSNGVCMCVLVVACTINGLTVCFYWRSWGKGVGPRLYVPNPAPVETHTHTHTHAKKSSCCHRVTHGHLS